MSETANRENAERIAEQVALLVSSRVRRAIPRDSCRRKKAAAASREARTRPDGELRHATFRTRSQSLFDELQR
jgi:uncharacterized membrane-anchored protein